MLPLLDVLLTSMHVVIILFNLFGWIWRRTRKLHLVVIMMTAVSWFLLGIWHGWGYCFLTDWHWDVKRELGETGLPNSFIKYQADKMTGRNWDATLIDRVTLYAFLGTIVATVISRFKRNKNRS